MDTVDTIILLQHYWEHVAAQDEAALRAYFDDNACIRWHCTNEQFTVDEFIKANCEYPGEWQTQIERIEAVGTTSITTTRVWTDGASFHACSFFSIFNGKVAELDEYWSDDEPAPQWRQAMRIGKPIR